jgi:D-aspartate ligase
MQLVPAIVAGCSKAGLAIIRALGARGVPVIGVGYGRSQIGLASRYVCARVRTCDPDSDEAGFLACLMELAQRWPGSVLFPSDDSSLVTLSRHRDRLSQAFRVVAERWSVVRSLIEKHRTYEIARAAAVPCPRLQIVRGTNEDLEFARQIGFPCLLKPSVGHLFFKKFSRKMVLIRSACELLPALAALQDCGGELMLSEFIPGEDTCNANYNSFCIDGAAVRELTAQKVRMRPSSIGFPTVVRSRHMPEVLRTGRRMAAALGYSGFSCMEFKRDIRDGTYKLMEVNGRHNYSGQLANACGIDFPWLSYLAASQRVLPLALDSVVPEMFWIDEERDTLALLRALCRGGSAVPSWLEPYRNAHVYAVFSGADPLPSVRLLGASLAHALSRGRVQASVPAPQL